jgi:hypothetical protein
MTTTLKQRFVDFAIRSADMREARKWLETQAATLDDDQRVEVDAYVVRALAKHYGLTAAQSEKNGILSGLTIKGEDTAAVNRARVALNGVRNILRGAEKVTQSLTDTLVKKAKSTKPETRAEVREAAYAALAALIAEGDGKTRDRIKQLMHLVGQVKAK